MTPALALVPASDHALSTELAVEVGRAKAYAAQARSPATLRAYTRAFDAFVAWCASRGIPSLPTTPAAIGVYLADLAHEGLKVSSLEQALAAIAHAHRQGGFEWIKGHPAVGDVMRGIRREHGAAVTKKAPISDGNLRALLVTCDADTLTGLRDRALLTLGWFGAFRRSELVSLHVQDVRFSADGLVVTLRRSKTDQDGEGYEKGIAYAGDPIACAVRALRRWLDAAGLTSGPIFRGINRHGNLVKGALGDRSVALIVKKAGEAANLDVSALAGHSLRSGFATTAARKGKGLDAIMRQTGHKSERIARGYIRHGTLFVDNATAGLF